MRKLLERRVHTRTMEALRIVVDHDLPVGRDVVDDAFADAKPIHTPGAKPLAKRIELCGKRRGRIGEVEEEMAIPQSDTGAAQRIVRELKTDHVVHLRSPGEAAA